jgi:hypothetical protein
MVILLSTAQPLLRLYDRESKADPTFVQRKEKGLRCAGTPNTLKEARKDCKNSKSGKLIVT